MPINVLEFITPETFHPEGYLLANLDVANHVKQSDSTALSHYTTYGHGEKRRQVSKTFLEERNAYFTRKFGIFRSVLKDEIPFRFKGEADSFPVVYGERHFSHLDYSVDSQGGNFHPFLEEIEANPEGLFMDLGAGLRRDVYDRCLYLEVYPSLTADIIVDPTCEYPIKSGSLDGICCAAVLEHTMYPWKVAEEIRRMLKPGGKAFINWPFLQPVHGYPSHYYNATRMGLELLFKEGFQIDRIATEKYEDPAFSFNWYLISLMGQLPEAERAEMARMTVGELTALSPMDPFWRRMVGALSDTAVRELACGNTLIATKTS